MVRLAMIADVHAHKEGRRQIEPVFAGIEEQADALVIAGDLTTLGIVEDAEALAQVLERVPIPKVGVLGNHDYHSRQDRRICETMVAAGVVMLNGSSTVLELNGVRVGFAGVKGFCGGFDPYAIESFGEPELKAFISTGVSEAVNLQAALSELDTPITVAILHFAPIPETVAGEPRELYPLLGSSLLWRPIVEKGVNLVVHGHAHYGTPFHQPENGPPVYNAARPLNHNRPVIHTFE
jgi:Icc-related predicted phosphoesterase